MNNKVSLFIFALLLLLLACTSKKEETNLQTKADNSSEYDLYSDTLSMEMAMQYVNNYGSHIAFDSITNPRKALNTRCIWFSIDRLKKLVDRIENEKGDGIRFYLAAYDTTYKKGIEAPNSTYWGHTTLVMVSTRKEGVNQKEAIHQDYYKDTNNFSTITFVNPLSEPENRGELCPPPKPCSGATLLR